MAWKRKLGWTGISLVAVILVLGIAGFVALRSQKFHSYVLAKIQQQASEATGAQVRIQDFALHLSTLSAEAHGITIRGSEPPSALPLAQSDQLMIRLKIVSLLHKKIDLNEIILRHPVVNFLVRKDGTQTFPPRRNRTATPLPVHSIWEYSMFFWNGARSTTTTSKRLWMQSCTRCNWKSNPSS